MLVLDYVPNELPNKRVTKVTSRDLVTRGVVCKTDDRGKRRASLTTEGTRT